MVKDRKLIWQNYLKGLFFFDLASVLPLDFIWIWLPSYTPWLRANRLIRVIRFPYYFSQWEKVILCNGALPSGFSLGCGPESFCKVVAWSCPLGSAVRLVCALDRRTSNSWRGAIRVPFQKCSSSKLPLASGQNRGIIPNNVSFCYLLIDNGFGCYPKSGAGLPISFPARVALSEGWPVRQLLTPLLQVTSLKPSVIRIFKSTFVILGLAHVIGCGFFLVIIIEGMMDETNGNKDFTGTDNILDKPLASKYIRAFYWCVAHHDPHPRPHHATTPNSCPTSRF